MKKREKIMEYVFLLAAVISIVAVALICIFLFANGIPAMKKIGFVEFLTGTKWKPGNNKFGIFPMILGSIYVTGGALIIGVPVGVLTSIFMETDTEEKTVSTVRIRPLTILLIVAGILVAAGLIFAGKKFYDNYYIIRHNREVRRNRKEQFRQMKSKPRRRRRRRR